MRTGYARADGIRVAYRDHGGDGPPLILVHATGFHGLVWLPWLDALRERFRVVTFDQRGHGDSDKPDADYRWESFAEDILAVVEATGLERPAGMGHSAGAAALVFAETTRPGTFSKLVLLDPVVAPPEIRELLRERGNPLAESTRRRRHLWPSVEQLVERLNGEGSPLAGWREDFLRAYAEHGTEPVEGGFRLKCPPEIEARIYEMGMRHAGWERLGELGCPTLLLAGDASHLWPPEHLARFPGLETDVLRGGHFFPMEHPDETLARALRFLDG